MRTGFLNCVFFSFLLTTGSVTAQQASDTVAPERATGVTEAQRTEATSFMVAAANPLAVEAGREIDTQSTQLHCEYNDIVIFTTASSIQTSVVTPTP